MEGAAFSVLDRPTPPKKKLSLKERMRLASENKSAKRQRDLVVSPEVSTDLKTFYSSRCVDAKDAAGTTPRKRAKAGTPSVSPKRLISGNVECDLSPPPTRSLSQSKVENNSGSRLISRDHQSKRRQTPSKSPNTSRRQKKTPLTNATPAQSVTPSPSPSPSPTKRKILNRTGASSSFDPLNNAHATPNQQSRQRTASAPAGDDSAFSASTAQVGLTASNGGEEPLRFLDPHVKTAKRLTLRERIQLARSKGSTKVRTPAVEDESDDESIVNNSQNCDNDEEESVRLSCDDPSVTTGGRVPSRNRTPATPSESRNRRTTAKGSAPSPSPSRSPSLPSPQRVTIVPARDSRSPLKVFAKSQNKQPIHSSSRRKVSPSSRNPPTSQTKRGKRTAASEVDAVVEKQSLNPPKRQLTAYHRLHESSESDNEDEKKLSLSKREMQEMGIEQARREELEYLLEGLEPNLSETVKIASVFQLVTELESPKIAHSLRTHGLLEKLFELVRQPLESSTLRLAFSGLLTIICSDPRNSIHISKECIEALVSFLAASNDVHEEEDIDTKRIDQCKKIQESLARLVEGFPIRQSIPDQTSFLCFKAVSEATKNQEQTKRLVRELGILDIVSKVVAQVSKTLQENSLDEEYARFSLSKVNASLGILEGCTFSSSRLSQDHLDSHANQGYLTNSNQSQTSERQDSNSPENTSLIMCLIEIVRFVGSMGKSARALVFGDEGLETIRHILNVLLNLTNDNDSGCHSLSDCGGIQVLLSLLVLDCPVGLRYDLDILTLGLLANCVEWNDSIRNSFRYHDVPTTGKDGKPLVLQSLHFLSDLFAECLEPGCTRYVAVGSTTADAERGLMSGYLATLLACLMKDSDHNVHTLLDRLSADHTESLLTCLREFADIQGNVQKHHTGRQSPSTVGGVQQVLESCEAAVANWKRRRSEEKDLLM